MENELDEVENRAAAAMMEVAAEYLPDDAVMVKISTTAALVSDIIITATSLVTQ